MNSSWDERCCADCGSFRVGDARGDIDGWCEKKRVFAEERGFDFSFAEVAVAEEATCPHWVDASSVAPSGKDVVDVSCE